MDYESVKRKYKFKNYVHFDYKHNAKSSHNYISDKNKISSHAFYPFIHYTSRFKKFDRARQKYKVKERSIYYASHIDRYIYQYYSAVLNERYNSFAKHHRFDSSAIAYRTNKQGKTNIHYAKEVFKFIKEVKDCYILVGDFESFFDKLGHINLKENIKMILNTSPLENDVFAVFKSITKFSYMDLNDIIGHYRVECGYSNHKIKQLPKYFEHDFNIQKEKYLKHHKESDIWKTEGIPQGTPLSGIMSNIYMINFDKELVEYAYKNNGLYRRYSDDFILIIEKSKVSGIQEIYTKVNNLIKVDGHLNVQREKFSLFDLDTTKIYSIDVDDFTRHSNPTFIDYLGFTFDGRTAFLRAKTISKFFYKAYGYIDTQLKIESRQKRKGKISRRSKRKIYEKFTANGSTFIKGKFRGNFITYVKRCNKIMNENEKELIFDDKNFIKKSRNKIIKRLSNNNIRLKRTS